VRAISPVIATVIIVSVAIAISIAVALWLTGSITSGFTQTENLQIVAAYATWDKNLAVWNVTLTVKNTGTTAATIDMIFVNDKPITITGKSINKVVNLTETTINPGDTAKIALYLTNYTYDNANNPLNKIFGVTNNDLLQALSGYSHGQMVNVKIHTASGRDYPRQLTLP